MFGLFKKVSIEQPELGSLTRHGKEWIGQIEVQSGLIVPLELEGTREAPHPQTCAAAFELPSKLPSLIPNISNHLLEHLEPYRDALSDPETGYADEIDDPVIVKRIQEIVSPQEAWSASKICGVAIGIERGKVRTLLKIDTEWDVEHALGAFYDDWQFMELNGSV